MIKNAPRTKEEFTECLIKFSNELSQHVHDDSGDWTIKGFIDVDKNIYPITSDTKVISKILEIQLLPYFIGFAQQYDFHWVPPDQQNKYPDMSFVSKDDPDIKFAVDIKTTYRLEENPEYCNGFTLGSHGEYFRDRTSTKNVQFPYGAYLGHFTLGIIYTRKLLSYLDEARLYEVTEIEKITSVIKDLDFFAVEKWRIASEKGGSGNTANIGSIIHIDDIKNGRGMFSKLGEEVFDDYWINYDTIVLPGQTRRNGRPKHITTIVDFLKYKGKDAAFIKKNIVPKKTSARVAREIKKIQLELGLDQNDDSGDNS